MAAILQLTTQFTADIFDIGHPCYGLQSGKTSAHLFCAAPLESFSRALVGLLNEIEHDARRAFAPCEVLCLFNFFAGLEHMELYTN